MKSRYPKQLVVPDGLRFADLQLRLDPESGNLDFDTDPVERMCAANGLNIDEVMEDEAVQMLLSWYIQHRRQGGEADAVLESEIEALRLESERGHDVPHAPGHA